jgi:hypothetical protein
VKEEFKVDYVQIRVDSDWLGHADPVYAWSVSGSGVYLVFHDKVLAYQVAAALTGAYNSALLDVYALQEEKDD